MNIEKHILEELIKAVKTINYGEVVITIHDSKIVQIEKKEKKRFDRILRAQGDTEPHRVQEKRLHKQSREI